MAKGKFREWLQEERLLLLRAWARDGHTDETIAKKMGIAVSTLYNWKNRYEEIAAALSRGKEIVDYEVENVLLQKALAGETTALMFWLKNRKPKTWRDKHDTNEPGGVVRIVDDV